MSTLNASIEPAASHPLVALARLLSQHWKYEAIHAVARLNIAEALVNGPRTVAELAEITGTHASSLHRLLRALASIGVFAELDGSRFVNTELSRLLRPGVPGSVSMLAKTNRDLILRPWGELL